MLGLLLAAFFGASLVSAAYAGDEDANADEDNKDDGPDGKGADETPTERDPDGDVPSTVLGQDARGSFVGKAGDDRISVEAETGSSAFYIWDRYVSTEVLLEASGGEGNDHLTLSGSGYVVKGDDGSDKIDLGDAAEVAVFAGEGDTVVGGTGANTFVHLSADAVFEGGAGNDLIHSSSSARAELGAGNDVFYGINEGPADQQAAQSVYGGSGDDRLHGGVDEKFLWWQHATDLNAISQDADTLDGGAGNDFLQGSHGDVLTGGEGADEFVVVLNANVQSDSTKITDFEPADETIVVRYGMDAGKFVDPDFFQSLDPSHFRVQETDDGDTILSDASGNELVHIVGSTGLVVGIQRVDEATGETQVTDLNGDEIPKESCSVIIRDLWH